MAYVLLTSFTDIIKAIQTNTKSCYVAGNDIIQIRKMKLWSCKILSQVPQRIGTRTGYQT